MQWYTNVALALVASVPAPQVVKVEIQENSWIAVAGFVLSLIIAVVQLVGWILPWTKRRKIIIERVGRIEVIFDASYGPNLGLHGIVCSDNKQSVVRLLHAVVVRKKDSSTRRFDVNLWRNPAITLGIQPTVTSTLAGPFIVPKDGAFSFYGIFVDVDLWMGELKAIREDLNQAWSLVVQERFGALSTPQTEQERQDRRAMAEVEYQQFMSDDPTKSAERLTRLYNWFSGDYALTITCEVRGDKFFSRHWNFRLTEKDEERLRCNIPNIQRMICQMDTSLTPYSVAIADYLEII